MPQVLVGDGYSHGNELVLGIISDPREARRRQRIRETWLPTESHLVISRFVVGNSSCKSAVHEAVAAEAITKSDVALVPTGDCAKWFSALKVHAWFVLAHRSWPRAKWFAKMEDDGILRVPALLEDLSSLSRRMHGSPAVPVYVGMMQWAGSCTLSEERRDGHEQKCAGCWGGWFSSFGKPGMMRKWERARYRIGPPTSNCASLIARVGDPIDCPQARLAPFACGPLDVRSNALASSMARCHYADRYFDALSRRSVVTGSMCASADGSQGHAVSECMRSGRYVVADIGRARWSMGSLNTQGLKEWRATGAANHTVVVHSVKTGLSHVWKRLWGHLMQTAYMPPDRLLVMEVTWPANTTSWPQVRGLPSTAPLSAMMHQ